MFLYSAVIAVTEGKDIIAVEVEVEGKLKDLLVLKQQREKMMIIVAASSTLANQLANFAAEYHSTASCRSTHST